MAIASVSVKSPERFCRRSDCRSCPMSIRARRLAVVVSWIGHPLVFVTISVGIVLTTQLASRAAIPLLAALFLSLIAPMGLLLFFGVRSGRWGDADVSVREERKRFYPIAIPLSALGTIVLWLANAPRSILRVGMITLLLLIAAAIINHWFQSFAPHFVCDLLHRDSLSCEYILRFGRIDSGRTRVLVAPSSFAPHAFRKHQRRRARHRGRNCHCLDVDLVMHQRCLFEC